MYLRYWIIIDHYIDKNTHNIFGAYIIAIEN